MIITVKPDAPIFSEINFPDFSGLLEGGLQYGYTLLNKNTNKFSLVIQIEYWLTEFGGENKFKVLTSESQFNVNTRKMLVKMKYMNYLDRLCTIYLHTCLITLPLWRKFTKSSRKHLYRH